MTVINGDLIYAHFIRFPIFSCTHPLRFNVDRGVNFGLRFGKINIFH